MELDNLSTKEVIELEIATGQPIFYQINDSGTALKMEG
jgi:bisphosphoglycerate-dependent phosphoglycerate mutase